MTSPQDDERPGRLSRLSGQRAPLEPGAFDALQARRKPAGRAVPFWWTASAIAVLGLALRFGTTAVDRVETGSAKADQPIAHQSGQAVRPSIQAISPTSSAAKHEEAELASEATETASTESPSSIRAAHAADATAPALTHTASSYRHSYGRRNAAATLVGGTALATAAKPEQPMPARLESDALPTASASLQGEILYGIADQSLRRAEENLASKEAPAVINAWDHIAEAKAAPTPRTVLPTERPCLWNPVLEAGLAVSYLAPQLSYDAAADKVRPNAVPQPSFGATAHLGIGHALCRRFGLRAAADVSAYQQETSLTDLPNRTSSLHLVTLANGDIHGEHMNGPHRMVTRTLGMATASAQVYYRPDCLPGTEVSAGAGYGLANAASLSRVVPMAGLRYHLGNGWSLSGQTQLLSLKATAVPGLPSSRGAAWSGQVGAVYAW